MRLPGAAAYPLQSVAPYAPDQAFPEFRGEVQPGATNPIFALVRGALAELGLDAGRYGSTDWNPLGDLAKPGAKIVVKPNWVLHENHGTADADCLITHPSVLRAVLEYVFLTKPAQVVLGDAPLQDCDFEKLLDFGGLCAVIAEFQGRGLPLIVKDFRRTVLRTDAGLKQVTEELRPETDYRLVDLGADSLLEPISKDWRKFRVTVYDPRKMWKHHRPGRHRYLVAREILDADLVVNVPKLKVHKKAGITCCLKNLIGINGNKEFLPHHRKGAADRGMGDDYPHAHWKLSLAEHLLDFANGCLRGYPRIYRLFERVAWRGMVQRQKKDPAAQLEGSWHGNDTIWRTCLDLNRALLYANREGEMTDAIQRKEISIVDAVVAGQGEGPLAPDPLPTGAVLVAHNPAVGDYLGAALLGFDPLKIPLLRHACDAMRWRICHAAPDIPAFNPPFPAAHPPKGWAGNIESSVN
ncbi:MAG: DUF362 domain-containing protein [Lentisphaerae bacterium]|jgi:uncharacterized protein (DUF362 family)|nr:DUF362 domain-containing protein [Lentisphaerota bacterium]